MSTNGSAHDNLANGAARDRSSQLEQESPPGTFTMPLDDEFIHADFLKHAHTLAASGARPSDPRTSALVDCLLRVSRLSARIACELTWDNIQSSSQGILNVHRDMEQSILAYTHQIERTIAVNRDRSHMTSSSLRDPGLGSPHPDDQSSSPGAVADWNIEDKEADLRDALIERLTYPLLDALKPDLHKALLKSLIDDLAGEVRLGLQAPLIDALKKRLLDTLIPELLEAILPDDIDDTSSMGTLPSSQPLIQAHGLPVRSCKLAHSKRPPVE